MSNAIATHSAAVVNMSNMIEIHFLSDNDILQSIGRTEDLRCIYESAALLELEFAQHYGHNVFKFKGDKHRPGK